MSITRFFGQFKRDETGSVTVEMVIVIPLLLWCFLALFVFFTAFRVQTVNLKSAYTIGDQLSRETGYVTPAYMDGLANLHTFLVNTEEDNSIRVTAFEYEKDDRSYRVIWSAGRGVPARVTNAQILDVRSQLPIMSDEEIAVLTETWVDYTPNSFAGLPPFTSYEIVVNSLRFAGQLCWNTLNSGTYTTSVCQAGY